MYVPRHPPLLPLRLFQGDLAQKVSPREMFNYFKVSSFKVKGSKGFKVSRFQGFKVKGSRFQGDLDQKVSPRDVQLFEPRLWATTCGTTCARV